MKHIGLFEGIGGFSLAGRWMGWQTVAWCEWDSFCQKVLKHHFPNAEAHGDITTTDFTSYTGGIDILTGGFPCQPYSSAGKRLGKEDDRHLWPEMLRAIREIRPRYVVGENVAGLLSWNGGLVFDEVQTDLEAEGYEVWAFILPACAVDAPHRRDRVWFVAYRNICSKESSGASRYSKKKRCKNNDEQKRWGQSSEQHFGCSEFLWPTSNAHCERLQKHGAFSKPNRSRQCVCNCNEDVTNPASCGRIQNNEKPEPRHFAQDIPNWRAFPTQSPVCGRNDGIPGGLAGISVSRHRRESIKAYGNAIVPQVAYQIFKAIQQMENS